MGAGGEDAGAGLIRLVHDLRTPLTIVQGFAELLERDGASLPDDDRALFSSRIAAAAREMQDILDAAG